ncbi:glycosyltransferase [Mariniflexile litorale]|uniref:Glycosyltransferase n=1 Tax=Mariniflexile litorale TaxID=3045158 RepID=A0AAU7EC98_9FLAO|nr:glycosyltransferase [Mariniflexile sp. KMM 9835]MDQ8212212.1 glycosyltransferase [Mariniflexile sp. KMM 9835]
MVDSTVSIFMLTYNQEQFIAQTIESVLMQKTDFDYQLVIGEDCSTDTTRTICEKYALAHPTKIKLLPPLEKNIGLIANYMRTIKACDGKYIAICDGDDYWIDAYKLQKQVVFLENNTNFSIVYTRVRKLFPNGEFKESTANLKKTTFSFDDLIFDNFIPSVSVLFKNIQDHQNQLPNWILKFPYGDWPTYLWTLKDGGRIHFLDDVTAVYRMDIGVSFKIRKVASAIVKTNLGITHEILNDFNFKHKQPVVQKALVNKKISLMVRYNRERNYLGAFKLYFYNLKYDLQHYPITKMYLYSLYKSF